MWTGTLLHYTMVHMCVYIHMCTHMYVCTCVYMYVHVCVHMCTYIHVHVCVYTYTCTIVYPKVFKLRPLRGRSSRKLCPTHRRSSQKLRPCKMWTLASHVCVCMVKIPRQRRFFAKSTRFLKDTAIKNCVRCYLAS